MGNIKNFLPSRNGLHYGNNWPDVPDKKLPTPFGDIGIGSASNGLCGGMAFAVCDLFEAGHPPPTNPRHPTPKSPAFDYLVNRLFDSFNLPAGVAQYYAWMTLPQHDTWMTRGTSWRTIQETMPMLRARIDSGHLCPLGLVLVHTADPTQLGENHQVVAWGYEDQGSRTSIRLYDPDSPRRDDISISFDHTAPSHTTTFHHSGGMDPVFGFFIVGYSPRDPSPLYKDGNEGGTPRVA